MTLLEDMADELAAADVHVGFAAQRADLARLLLKAGVSTDDVALLAAHCRETVREPGAAPRVLAALLVDHAKRDERLADLRAVAAVKATRNRAFGDAKTEPGRPLEEEPAAWQAVRNAAIAFCRVVTDRAPRETVAAELGVSLDQLDQLVERERRQRGVVKPARIVDDRSEESDRRRQFREQMLAARRQAAQA